MKKLFSLSRFSPFWITSFWSVILLTGFLPVVPQPASIIGYLWKVEFAFAAFIFLTLAVGLRFSSGKITPHSFDSRETRFIILPLILFTAWSGFSCVWAESFRGALHHTLLWACYGLFYLLVRQIVNKPRLLGVSLSVTGIVASMLGVLCFIEYLTTPAEMSVNITLRYSKYAEILAALLPVFVVLAIGRKNRNSLLFGAVGLVAWLGIVFSLGRTEILAGLIGISVLAFLIIFYCRQKVSLKKAVLFSGLLILLTVFSQFLSAFGNEQQTTLNRFSSDAQSKTSFQVRFLYWNIALQSFKQNKILGIGADNYIADYKTARENYSNQNPENPLLAITEELLPERAHNEFLQILAELGIVGAILFAWLLFGIAQIGFSFQRKSVSPLSLAGFAGIVAFLISSMASSYSFRVPANGLCFFFLLALAVQGLQKNEGERESFTEKQFTFNFSRIKPTFTTIGLIICCSMLAFSAVRGLSLMYLQKALSGSGKTEIEENFQKAMALDGQEGMFKYSYGTSLYNSGRMEESASQMRFAIDKGIATSIAYFYLAAAQIGAKKPAEAEQTLLEALRLYPRSIFLRTFYAFLLKENGKTEQSEIEYAKALQINSEQAKSWRVAQTEGATRLSRMQNGGENFVVVMELRPTDGIYALLDFQRQNNPELLPR